MRTGLLCLALLALLLSRPLLALAQDGDEAKKLFQAMEERLAKAKTVSLGFSIDVEVDGKKVGAAKGSLAFARGNRARFESEARAEGQKAGDGARTTLTSDGKQLRYIEVEGKRVLKDKVIPTPRTLSADLAWLLSRAGLSFGFESLELSVIRPKELKADELFPISDLKLGGREKVEGRETRVLTYKVRDYRGKTANITLWVDPLTHLPRKRAAVMTGGGAKGRLIELYTGIKTDEKIDSRRFALPK